MSINRQLKPSVTVQVANLTHQISSGIPGYMSERKKSFIHMETRWCSSMKHTKKGSILAYLDTFAKAKRNAENECSVCCQLDRFAYH